MSEPTREEMARALDNINVYPLSRDDAEQTQRAIDAAASALRQTCAHCQHFERHSTRRGQPLTWVQCNDRNVAVYQFDNDDILPRDGTGYCHRWAAKETP